MKKVLILPLVILLSACGQAPTPITTHSQQVQSDYPVCFNVISATNDSGLFTKEGEVFELSQQQQDTCVAELEMEKLISEDLALRQKLYNELEGEEISVVLTLAGQGKLEIGQQFKFKHHTQLQGSFEPNSESIRHSEQQRTLSEYQVVHQVPSDDSQGNMWVVVPDMRGAISLNIITDTEQEIGSQWRDLQFKNRTYVYQGSELQPQDVGNFSGHHTFKVLTKGN